MSPDLLAVAREAALAAGELILSRWDSIHQVTLKSSKTDPVTEVDQASESLIRELIARHRPDDAVIGEEAGREGGESAIWWVIDPLDGTVNFLYGRDDVAVSVAAVDRHGPLATCVHAPRLGRTYVAERGQGAWLNGVRLALGEPRGLDRALLGTGFSYEAEGRLAQVEVLSRVLPRVADLRRGGSAALDICSVATGGIDVFIEDDLAEWDWIGAALVVMEAGGVCFPIASPRGSHGVAVGPRALVEELLRVANCY
ncbi:MAG: inositol monophosphatase [Actinobacteria bacterium]|nr:inositol monophosphatase [Actinomycetota bacterium]